MTQDKASRGSDLASAAPPPPSTEKEIDADTVTIMHKGSDKTVICGAWAIPEYEAQGYSVDKVATAKARAGESTETFKGVNTGRLSPPPSTGSPGREDVKLVIENLCHIHMNMLRKAEKDFGLVYLDPGELKDIREIALDAATLIDKLSRLTRVASPSPAKPDTSGLRAALEALDMMRSFVVVMFGHGPDAIIPETVRTPLGPPVKIGEIVREASAGLETLRALLSTTPPVSRCQIPDGWQLVPKEPTEEMINASFETITSGYLDEGLEAIERRHHANYYRAMLAAAPPSQSEER